MLGYQCPDYGGQMRTTATMSDPPIHEATGKKMSKSPCARRLDSVEAAANAVVGLVVSTLAVRLIWPVFGWEASGGQATGVAVFFFVMSAARSYFLRRLFRCLPELRQEAATSPQMIAGRRPRDRQKAACQYPVR